MAVRLSWRGAAVSSLFLFLAVYHLISHHQHYPVRAPAWDGAYHHLALRTTALHDDGTTCADLTARSFASNRSGGSDTLMHQIPRVTIVFIAPILSNSIDDQRNDSERGGTLVISIILGIYPAFLPSCLSLSEKKNNTNDVKITE